MPALRFVAVIVACVFVAAPHAQESLADAARRKSFDQILDLYVRNGDVYYRALKSDRGKLDGFVNLIATASVDKRPPDEQVAFWLNAYNALVLRTVVDHYPIAGHAADYPQKCVTRAQCVQLDRDSGKMTVSSIFSWHEKEFADTYGDKAPASVSNRSPIERAAVAFVFPKLLSAERDMVEKNTFQVAYKPFDWTLNDLTGRGGR